MDKVTCLARLGNRMSEEEIQVIEALRKVKTHKWGALNIVVRKGEVMMISPTYDTRLK